MTSGIGEASTLDGVRFTAQVAVPNVAAGLYKRRKTVSDAARLIDADKQAVRFYEGLVRKFGDNPFFIRVGKDKSVIVHHPDDIRAVLDGSPHPFASDPPPKKKGMSHFQPHALTLSRGSLWETRRRFAEAVLETPNPLHSLTETFLAIANEEADALAKQEITWDAINTTFQRLTRRVVFGTPAADDTELTDALGTLMEEANNSPGSESPSFAPFMARVTSYVDDAAPGSLAGLVAAAPTDGVGDVPGQLVHWLFAMGDTLPANTFRTLAVLATHPDALGAARAELDAADHTTAAGVGGLAYVAAALQDTMRLWPTTPMFGRVTTTETTLRGTTIPEGTQVFIYNTGNHRNRDRIPFADRFAPEEWRDGTAGSDWSFNFFSHGAQGCPGAGLAVFLGVAVLARLLDAGTPRIVSGPTLKPDAPLPHTLDIFGLRVAVDPS